MPFSYRYILYLVVISVVSQTLHQLGADVDPSFKISKEIPAEIRRVDPPFKITQFTRPRFENRFFDIRMFGAKDGITTKNTRAFKKAIDTCYFAGGGTVIVPKGVWLTGQIHLKSNVNLHFEEGAELHFSPDPNDYLPVVFTRWAGFELYNYSPLIYACDCVNIAITGPGKLFGNGEPWWKWKDIQEQTAKDIYENQVLKGVKPEKRIYGTPTAGLRPQFISPINCKHILLEGFTVASAGPFWTFDITYCDDVIVRDLKINTTGGPNTDGINIDSSKNVLIEHCIIDAGDDAITLKSGINEDGWRVARPVEKVVIRDITALHCHGGIVIGSEMSGGIRDIFVHNCYFNGADRGIRIKSNASRGGVVEELWFKNIRMHDIKQEAICINTNYKAFMASKDGRAYPVFRNIRIQNLTCNGAAVAAYLRGTSNEPLRHIILSNVSVEAKQGMYFEWVYGLKLDHVSVKSLQSNPISILNCQNILQNVKQ